MYQEIVGYDTVEEGLDHGDIAIILIPTSEPSNGTHWGSVSIKVENLVRELLSYLGRDILEHRFATDAVYLAFKLDEICVSLQEQRH